MPYIKVFVSEEQLPQVLTLSQVYQTSVATLLRPAVCASILQLWSVYSEVSNRSLHQQIIARAMEFQNTTIKELVEWTGLEREIVKTTLSELIELGRVREHAGRGKVVNYFLIKMPSQTEIKPKK